MIGEALILHQLFDAGIFHKPAFQTHHEYHRRQLRYRFDWKGQGSA